MYKLDGELSFTRCGADGRLKIHDAVAMMMDCCQFQELYSCFQVSGGSAQHTEKGFR